MKLKYLQTGFSFFELLVVLIIVAFVFLFGRDAYFSQIDKTRGQLTKFQAATFTRMVQNIQAYGIATKSKKIDLLDKTVYVNEFGYPANSDRNQSPNSNNQTDEECLQLWRSFFETAEKSKKNKLFFTKVNATSRKNEYCRYELYPKEAGNYFFDYYFKTGMVLISQLE